MFEKKNEEAEIVMYAKVFLSGNGLTISLAKSILQDAGIEYVVINEQLQNLFGIGSLGGHVNPLSGPIELWTNKEDEEIAFELLKNLRD